MNELKPNVAQMISVAYACGLSTLNEAYDQYMLHYDCFFLIDKFHEQHKDFVEELKDFGFIDEENGVLSLVEYSLDSCAHILGIVLENSYEAYMNALEDKEKGEKEDVITELS